MPNVSLINGHIDNADRCVHCGAIIPEGRWHCPKCETPKEALNILDETVIGNFELKIVLSNAIEKQIPKKPIPQVIKGGKALIGNGWWCEGSTVYRCPCCNEFISRTYDYCYKCGQALDWSDTE